MDIVQIIIVELYKYWMKEELDMVLSIFKEMEKKKRERF